MILLPMEIRQHQMEAHPPVRHRMVLRIQLQLPIQHRIAQPQTVQQQKARHRIAQRLPLQRQQVRHPRPQRAAQPRLLQQ